MGNTHSGERKPHKISSEGLPGKDKSPRNMEFNPSESDKHTTESISIGRKLPLRRGRHSSQSSVLAKKIHRSSISNQNQSDGIFGLGMGSPVVGSPLIDPAYNSIPISSNLRNDPRIHPRGIRSIHSNNMANNRPFMNDQMPETFIEQSAISRFMNDSNLNRNINKLVSVNELADEKTFVPTLIKWEDSADNVYVSGSFNQWKYKIKLKREDGIWSTMINLPVGMHMIKFIVDGEWQYSRNMVIAPDDHGNLVNYIKIEEVFIDSLEDNSNDNVEGLDSDMFSGSPPGEYTGVIPEFSNYSVNRDGSYKRIDPPLLPPHLNQVLLNSADLKDDGLSTLPVPNHVVLNHLYACSIKDNVMAVSISYNSLLQACNMNSGMENDNEIQVEESVITIDDLDLPMANIVRIIKDSIPEGTMIQKEVRMAVSRACTVFINYLCSAQVLIIVKGANDMARSSGHKTVQAKDILSALPELEMEEYVEILKEELEEFQELIKKKKLAKDHGGDKTNDEQSDGENLDETNLEETSLETELNNQDLDTTEIVENTEILETKTVMHVVDSDEENFETEFDDSDISKTKRMRTTTK
ncbi:hypothetical protein BB559_000993 [Furculomyces boomerangus]|uniref:Association with the SNF1 complex (ASC) domain-containing protein n=1 Tax=Furculomyces boomerangus TaxID=61424 RepID=A0A2T9Z3I5_9FUNG|nr:hypothetical protein BB559_000993 [Furculomyces boomerangus]